MSPRPSLGNWLKGLQTGGTAGGKATTQREGRDFPRVTQLGLTEPGPEAGASGSRLLGHPIPRLAGGKLQEQVCTQATERMCTSAERKSMAGNNGRAASSLCGPGQVTSSL